uniref:Uncharacterized protein n=1 Tax=uncultured bacterium 20 TaxID=1748270 RepID=A0A0U3UVM9_9BACT|nr:hypothetical protein [uncultured bacterium 20]
MLVFGGIPVSGSENVTAKQSIAFREVENDIGQPRTKFGGQPIWIGAPAVVKDGFHSTEEIGLT